MAVIGKIPLLIFIGITETFLIHFQLSMLMERKRGGRGIYWIMLVVYFMVTIYDAANDFKVYFVFLIAYVLIAVTAYLSYEGTKASKFSISFVCIAINYSATIYSAVITCRVFSDRYPDFPTNLGMNYSTQIMLTVLCICFVYLLRLYTKHMSTKLVPMMMTAFVVPLAISLLLLKQFYINQLPSTPALQEEGHIIVATLLLLSATLLYSLTSVNNLLDNSLRYSATLEQMLAMQEKYYNDLQKHQKELRRINHDTKNHTRAMISLIEAQQYDEAKEYALSLQKTILSTTAPVTNCDNQLINSLLNDKLGNAKQNGVELSLCVMVPSVLKIDSVDVCILLGNLLDNAVEACAHMEQEDKKFIDVDIRIRGFFICFDVSNSYSAPLELSNSTYLTTKKDKLFHGVGLSNVQRVVDKYEGRLNISHERNVFNVSALLSYPGD